MLTVEEQDCVIGTFTNRTSYIGKLSDSIRKYFPEIMYISKMTNSTILDGMTILRNEFIKSDKRYWVFMDDDIQFLNSEIIKNALKTLIAGKYGCVTVYSTFNPSYLDAFYNSGDERLVRKTIPWSTGYFMMVDSKRVGNIVPDKNLPHPNLGVDLSYSIEIKKAGFEIGVSNDYVYHLFKNQPHDIEAWDETQRYMTQKYGQFYGNCVSEVLSVVIQ